MFAIITIILPLYLTLPDRDGDGYSDVRELVGGCDLFDPESFPYCVDGFDYSISCFPEGPGISVVLVPCDL